jgi:hypothetical protein
MLTTHDSDDSVQLYLGGANRIYCIHVYIIKPTAPIAAFRDVSVGNLMRADYNMKCTLDGTIFERGIDVRRAILIMTDIVLQRYPHVVALDLTDTSARPCDNGVSVMLAHLNFLAFGKTWYERTFDATLVSSQTQFARAMRIYGESKRVVPWTSVRNKLNFQGSAAEEEVRGLYESTATWAEFFAALHGAVGLPDFCNTMSGWMLEFMVTYLPFDFSLATYRIDVRKVLAMMSVEYTVSAAARGGRRRITRRR